MDSTTQILEILIIVLVSIEVIELYFNLRAIKVHEKELNGHLAKLEQHSKKIDTFTNLVNQLDEHIRTLDRLLLKKESSET